MIVLKAYLDNLYSFKNFEISFVYPKKIVGSTIKNEHLEECPNFRYKKVNILMGANASGKTTFGQVLMKIFNFIDNKNFENITNIIRNRDQEATFILDLAAGKNKIHEANIFYRVRCVISPSSDNKYKSEDIHLSIIDEPITAKDSYESCVKRIEAREYTPEDTYIEELEKMGLLDWIFEYPQEKDRILRFPHNDTKFKFVLENILKALDPSIVSVEESKDVDNSYVVRLANKVIILQDGEEFNTDVLSSGTKAGVEVAPIVSSLLQERNTFYYCDEKFSYIHSDFEKAILSLMIDYVKSNDQLFFTTHNPDIVNLNLPKHAFTFLRKNVDDPECPISCVDASSILKRNTDSLKNAVENDLFDSSPSVDLIYALAGI